MKQLRTRLTYANVMSSIAVFLVLGGATAFAASHLGKNTVGTKQLKNNSVTSGKLKKNSVTTAKVADGAITGAKVNLSSLGKVPSASNADNASSAGNANTVAGSTVRKFFYASNATGGTTTILALDGLTLTASCPAGTPEGRAQTSVPGSLIHSGGTTLGSTPFYAELDSFNPGDQFDFLDSAVTFGDSVQGTLTYAQPGGTVVTAVFAAEEFGLGSSCVFSGHAIG